MGSTLPAVGALACHRASFHHRFAARFGRSAASAPRPCGPAPIRCAALRCRSSGRFRSFPRPIASLPTGSTRCRERPGPPVGRQRQTLLLPQPPQNRPITAPAENRPPRPGCAMRRRAQLAEVSFAEFAFHDDSLLFCRRHRRRSVGSGRGSFAYSSGRGGRRDGSPAPLSSAHRTTPAPPQIIAFLSASSGRLCRPSLRSDVDLLSPLAR